MSFFLIFYDFCSKNARFEHFCEFDRFCHVERSETSLPVREFALNGCPDLLRSLDYARDDRSEDCQNAHERDLLRKCDLVQDDSLEICGMTIRRPQIFLFKKAQRVSIACSTSGECSLKKSSSFFMKSSSSRFPFSVRAIRRQRLSISP